MHARPYNSVLQDKRFRISLIFINLDLFLEKVTIFIQIRSSDLSGWPFELEVMLANAKMRFSGNLRVHG